MCTLIFSDCKVQKLIDSINSSQGHAKVAYFSLIHPLWYMRTYEYTVYIQYSSAQVTRKQLVIREALKLC